ncbi:MAG: hypothetical protein ACK2U5_12970 [Candidatus Promineifilaceae bacterium]|jgi:cell division protein FtsB
MSEKSSEQEKSRVTSRKRARQRPLLSLPQILVLAGIVFAIYVGFDLNRRAQAGAEIEHTEQVMEERVNLETTRQVELMMTREYVNSDAYVAAYARNEAGQLMPGEKKIVPLLINATAVATPVPTATPDPAYDARPWQAWWRLISDAPLPAQ